MKASYFVLLTLFVSACALPVQSGDSSTTTPKTEDKEKKEESKARKKDELKRKIEIARIKIEVTKAVVKSFEIETELELNKAKTEKDLAERELKQFSDVDMPRRLEESKLGIQESKDYVQDSKDELAQLEDMYKDGDLADKTREIVLQRGRRRVERANKRLALQEVEAQSLEKYKLPLEKEKLSLALKEKVDALQKAERDAAKEKLEKKIATIEAEAELANLEMELADIEKEKAESKS